MDKQGRVLLPAYLREAIGLGNEAVVVGSRDHAEIWAPDRLGHVPQGPRRPSRSWPRPSKGWGSSAADYMRFQDPFGIRSFGMEER